MRNVDYILWLILAITGLNFVNHRLDSVAKLFRIHFMIFFTISLLYLLILHLYYMKFVYKQSIIRSLMCIYSGIMWCVFYLKRKAISYVVLEMYRQKNVIILQRERWITS